MDARTLHEVYYPPFAAAVAAGAASVMCSYNRVRSSAQPAGLYEHACGNAQVLQTDLNAETLTLTLTLTPTPTPTPTFTLNPNSNPNPNPSPNPRARLERLG